MSERYLCPKCGGVLDEETVVEGYPFVCYRCDENFYRFEAQKLYRTNECPHCGKHDDWSDIEWEDPFDYELVAWARCPECGGLHKLVFTLTENIPTAG